MVNDPKNSKILHSRFVFLKKFKIDGTLDRHKARLVVKGYGQTHVKHVYALVLEFNAIRVAVACLMTTGGVIHQLDVKTAFLNGKVRREHFIFIHPLVGLNLCLKHSLVLKLDKALYGLKEAPHIWNRTFDATLRSRGFMRLLSDNCVYVYHVSERPVWILIYVDDVLVLAWSNVDVAHVKGILMAAFKMKDLGLAKQFLGVEFRQRNNGVFMSQEKYTRSVLKRFGMEDSKAVRTPLIAVKKTT